LNKKRILRPESIYIDSGFATAKRPVHYFTCVSANIAVCCFKAKHAQGSSSDLSNERVALSLALSIAGGVINGSILPVLVKPPTGEITETEKIS